MEVTNIPVEPVDVEKVAEENPQSRFRILDTAIHRPGTCLICLSPGGDGRQFVDFNRTDTWYGVVYVCTFCLAEAAALLGLRNSLEAESHIIGLMDSQKVHIEKIAELGEDLNAARRLLRNCSCSNSDSGGTKPYTLPLDVEPNDEGSGSTSNVDESSSVEGIDDISSTSNDESAAKPKRTRRSVSSAE